MKRTGADKGHGSGYRNLRNFPKDPRVHSQSAKGVKQPQTVSFPEIRHIKVQEYAISLKRKSDGSYEPAEIRTVFAQNYMVAAKKLNVSPYAMRTYGIIVKPEWMEHKLVGLAIVGTAGYLIGRDKKKAAKMEHHSGKAYHFIREDGRGRVYQNVVTGEYERTGKGDNDSLKDELLEDSGEKKERIVARLNELAEELNSASPSRKVDIKQQIKDLQTQYKMAVKEEKIRDSMKAEMMEHHKDMPVQEIDSMLIGFDHSDSSTPTISQSSLATDMPPPPQPPKESLFTRAGRGALELAKKSKQYGADYLAKQKELSQLKKQAEIETIEHPAVQDLKKQRERVTELEYQVATTEDPDKVNRLETELEAERTQLREKQEIVTNIKVEDLSDVELKLLAVRHVQGTGFFSGMFGQSNPYKAELLRRITFKRQLERDMTQIEKQQDALDKAAKEGKKEGGGGFFDFLP